MQKTIFILLAALAAGLVFFNMNNTTEADSIVKQEVSETIQKTSNEATTAKNETVADKTLSNEVTVEKESPTPVVAEKVNKVSATTATVNVTNKVDMSNAQEVKMKIKAKEKDGVVKAKVAISHDMLTYMQAEKKGLEANFISHITAMVGDKVVYDISTSQFLSKNPLVKFSFKGKKGEELKIIYTQLKGEMFYASKKIK